MVETSPVALVEELTTQVTGRPAGGFSLLWLGLAFVTVVYAGATVLPFFSDLLGLGTAPGLAIAGIAVGGLALLGLAAWQIWQRQFQPELGGLVVAGLAFGLTWLYCLNQAAPFHNLPVGITADQVHHYALADYIRSHHALPLHATPADRARLVEMTTYPPAFHLSAALASETLGLNLAYVLFPLAAFFMAICSAATAALTYTLLRASFLRPLLALVAACAAYLAYGFCFDSFMYWDFYGQLAGQGALGLGLYFALHYYKTGYWPSLALGSLAGAILTLAYTHWLPILGLALVGAALGQPIYRWRTRLISLLVVSGWLALVAGLFIKDRLSGGVVWSGGAGADIKIEEPGLLWPVLVIIILGAALSTFNLVSRKSKIENRKYLALLYGFLALATGAYTLFVVGNDLAKSSPPHLYPFDTACVWLMGLAGLGAVVALFKDRTNRFYLFTLGGLVLEVVGYLTVKPGGAANAYHLSKMFVIALALLLPGLVGPLLEAVLLDLPAFVARRLPGKAAPKWTNGVLSGLALLVCLPVAFFADDRLQSHELGHIPLLDPALVDISQHINAGQLDRSKIELAVQGGIPAYFTYVGLLGQPRDQQANDYYNGQRHSFESWLYNPHSRPYLLADQYDAIKRDYAEDSRFRVVYSAADGKIALLTQADDYQAQLEQRRPLYLKFQGQLEGDVVTANLDLAGFKDTLSILQPAIVVGPLAENGAPLLTQPLVSLPITLANSGEAYSLQKGYLKLRLGEGYSRGAWNDRDLPNQPFKLGAGRYSVWVQLWKNGQPVTQRKVQDFEYAPGRLVPLAALNSPEPALPNRTGQLLLQNPSPVTASLTSANTFFQEDDRKLLEITGWGVAPGFAPGGTLTLYERFLPVADLSTGYTIYVHLLDAKGAVVAGNDSEPGQGLYPTWLWRKDQPVTFSQSFKLPANLPPGQYSLELGVYSGSNQKSLETWFYEPYVNRIWENRFLVKEAVTLK